MVNTNSIARDVPAQSQKRQRTGWVRS